jgi:hypothetical protein
MKKLMFLIIALCCFYSVDTVYASEPVQTNISNKLVDEIYPEPIMKDIVKRLADEIYPDPIVGNNGIGKIVSKLVDEIYPEPVIRQGD